MTDERTNFVSIAAGLCFIALGVLLLLERNGIVQLQQIIRLWPMALVAMGAAVVLQGLRGGEAARRVHLGGIIWLLVLGSIVTYAFARRSTAAEDLRDGRVNVFAVLSGDRQPAISGAFHGGAVTAVMGGAVLDLRGTSLAPGESVVVDVFTFMGGSEVRVPDDWDVQIEATTIMGGNHNTHRRQTLDANRPAPPRLILRGTTIMGGINVKS